MPDVVPQQPTVAQQQMQVIKEGDHYFKPKDGLPVVIDFRTDSVNPYSLSEDVAYSNGVVNALMERGFKWDGASIPVWIPLVPWVLTLIVMQFWPSPWVLIATGALVLYAIRLLPYMQKMGLHSRAGCVHDKLCRAQKVSRVVADAIMLEIMEYDGVPWDVRTIIYRRVRQFGWIAWRNNKRALRAKEAAGKDVQVTSPDLDLAKKN
jgi:hypothetical protein